MQKDFKKIRDLAYAVSYLDECIKYAVEYIESGKIKDENEKEALLELLKTGLAVYEELGIGE